MRIKSICRYKEMVKSSRNPGSENHGATAVAVIGTGAVISAVDWKMVVCSAAVAGIVSVLTSVAGIPEVPEETVK